MRKIRWFFWLVFSSPFPWVSSSSRP